MSTVKYLVIFPLLLILITSLITGFVSAEGLLFNYEISVDEQGNMIIKPTFAENNFFSQEGRFNIAVQFWTAVNNFNSIYQVGERNFSFIYQEGEENKASITQEGNNNTAVIKQSSDSENDEQNEEED